MSKRKTHVLVTGGAGYIGSVLVPRLIDDGYRVSIYDKYYFGNGHLDKYKKKASFIKGDIQSLAPNILKGVDAVIHLAAFSNDPMANFAPKLNFAVNTEATINLAKMAKDLGVKRFIYASSCSIYHRDKQRKTVNSETSRVNPKEHYSKSKYLAEQEILSFSDRNFVLTSLRKGTVGGYSPRMRFDLVVNTMVKTAFTDGRLVVFDGSQYRPLIDIRDVVEAYIKVLQAPPRKVNGKIFNVLQKNYQIRNLAKRVVNKLKQMIDKVVPIKFRPRIKDRTYRVSGASIKNQLNFSPEYTMEDSVESVVNFIQSKPRINLHSVGFYNIETMKRHLKAE